DGLSSSPLALLKFLPLDQARSFGDVGSMSGLPPQADLDASSRQVRMPGAVIAAVRRTGVTEYWIELPRQSALMLDARVTLPHLPVSSAINLPKSPGESASTVPPRSARLTFMLGSARAALISLLSLSTISVGVFFGAPRPYQPLAS